MNLLKKIGTFLKPYKWETIWTGEAEGVITQGGRRISKTTIICVVQMDKNKKTLRSYMTNGGIEKDIDLNWLTGQSDQLKAVLRNNGMPVS